MFTAFSFVQKVWCFVQQIIRVVKKTTFLCNSDMLVLERSEMWC